MASRYARCWAIALFVLMTSGLGGCSQKEVKCGGRVAPEKLTDEDRAILDKVKAESSSYCSGGGSGCDFRLVRTKEGWSVAATRIQRRGDRCLFRPGGQQFYIYDETGTFRRVIGGL